VGEPLDLGAGVDVARPSLLVVAIIQICDLRVLTQRLVDDGFGVTRIDAYGGFLRHDTAALLVATTERRVAAIRAAVQELCPRRTASVPPPPNDGTLGLAVEYGPERVELGGAVVFILPVERVEYLGVSTVPVPPRAGEAANRRTGDPASSSVPERTSAHSPVAG
jgi:uncharacterized protein YaaQ